MDVSAIILSNLYENGNLLGRDLEVRLSHLSELADCIVSGSSASDTDGFRDSFFTAREDLLHTYRHTVSKVTAPVCRESVGYIFDRLSVADMAELCRGIASKNASPYGKTETKRIESARIACFRNSLSEAAYRTFAKELPMASAVFSDDFASSCEDVYSHRADFCILPVSDSDDGALLPFIKLAYRYELFAPLACETVSGGERVSRFCLFGQDRFYRRGSDTMDVLVSVAAENLGKLLCGLEQLGAVCENIADLPGSMFEDENYYLSLRFGRDGPEQILLFLRLFALSVSLCGIYKCIGSADKRKK